MRTLKLFTVGVALLAIGSVACIPSDYDVEVSLLCPGYQSVPGVEITTLPFDRDALRDSIAAASEMPRPQFQDLVSEFKTFEQADFTGLEATLAPWQAIYDSVQLLAESLNALGPDSSTQYARAYNRLRDQYQRLAQTTVQRDAAISDLVGNAKELALSAAAAADSLRAWEGAALSTFPQLADSAIALSGRGIHRAKTDRNGVAEFTLVPGHWWIVARCSDPANPFIERYWNVSTTVRLFGAKSVVLDENNAIESWRY